MVFQTTRLPGSRIKRERSSRSVVLLAGEGAEMRIGKIIWPLQVKENNWTKRFYYQWLTRMSWTNLFTEIIQKRRRNFFLNKPVWEAETGGP